MACLNKKVNIMIISIIMMLIFVLVPNNSQARVIMRMSHDNKPTRVLPEVVHTNDYNDTDPKPTPSRAIPSPTPHWS